MRIRLAAAVVFALVFAGTALAASTGPQVQIDAADQAWAVSIQLSAADVGTAWTSSGSGISLSADNSGGDSGCPGFAVDESDLTATGGQSSPDFTTRSGGYLSSQAIVWSTADQAQADWDRQQQAGYLDCLAASVAASSTKTVKIKVASKGPLQYPSIAPRTVAYRLHLLYTTKVRVKKSKKLRTVSVPANFDIVLIGNGRATAALYALSFTVAPITDTFEQQLVTTVAGRLAADPHP